MFRNKLIVIFLSLNVCLFVIIKGNFSYKLTYSDVVGLYILQYTRGLFSLDAMHIQGHVYI